MKILPIAALLTITFTASPTFAAAPQFGVWGFDASGMDTSVRPGADFFRYVNGTWDKRTAIPDDRAGYGVDAILSDTAQREVREILEAAPVATTGSVGEDALKVHAAYLAFMDQARIEAAGAAPIAPDLAAIRAAKSRSDLTALMGHANVGFGSSVFDVGISEDAKSPDRYAVYLSQGGLGLPNRDYYLEATFAAKKVAYQAYVARMLTLAGWPEPDANAAAIVAFETRIANVSWTRAEERDPDKEYNPMSPAELAKAAPGLDWAVFLREAGLGGVSRVIVGENTAFPKIAAIYAETPIDTLKAWSAFHVVDDAATDLDHRFDDAHFEFRGKTLQGQKVQRERWKRAVTFVDGGLGEAVGRVYVAKYFPPESKAKIDALVGELRVALGKRIANLDWMSPETKAKAQAKLAKFTVKIAYPDKWRDYSALKVSGDVPSDAKAFARFEWNRDLKRLDDPVDRTEWGMTPQTVNAYYNPSANEIVFPAAILGPPYFDPNADAAANYGAVGAVIGHEMSHGFDDEGRKFDGTGALSDWWTPADIAKFDARVKTLNAQFDAYSPFPGVHVKGDQTTGENLADLAGILIALDAYHASLGGKPAPMIDGLTGDQRFFLAFAQSWRDKRREDSLRNQLATDVHSPEVYRVNGVVRNVDAWYPSFDVSPKDALYLSPKDRVRIW